MIDIGNCIACTVTDNGLALGTLNWRNTGIVNFYDQN